MKRILAMLLALLCLASCGGPSDTTVQDETAQPADSGTANTNIPEETSAPETEAPAPEETEAPALEETDEPSPLAAVSPSANGCFKITFENGVSVEFDATNATTAFEKAKALGYPGTVNGWMTTSVLNIESKLAKESGLGAKALGTAMAAMLANYEEYFSIGGEKMDGEVKIIENTGYMGQNGSPAPNSETQTYRYTQRIPVVEGQTVSIVSDGNKLGMRFVTAFQNGVADESKAMIDTSCTKTEFTVPAGVTHVVATYRHTGKDVYAVLTGGRSEAKPTLKNKADSDTLVELATGAPAPFNANLTATADSLKDGYLYLEENDIMHNKTLRLTFNIDALGEGQMITLGHGEKSYGGSAVELTKDTVRVYKYFTERIDVYTAAHGINISGIIELEVKVGFGKATISVENKDDKFVSDITEWFGRQGKIFAKSSGGAVLTDVQMEWKCSDYAQEIWLMGDSYFNTTVADRWPYYMYNNGYTDYFMSGFPGRNSQQALTDFKRALEHGTPKYAVWCLGMNNNDSETAISSTYKAATDEFLAICASKGITPILSTIPNTPTCINVHKNEWVRNSGYRYIDFAAAVDGEQIYSSWSAGMLSGDHIHPAVLGAETLYMQFIKDFPEIRG